jgi:hypothetical protein
VPGPPALVRLVPYNLLTQMLASLLGLGYCLLGGTATSSQILWPEPDITRECPTTMKFPVRRRPQPTTGGSKW